MSNFRKLDVYKKALDFTKEIYNISRTFPQEEQYALTSQLKRAATSICINIAEGCGRKSKRDFTQFLRISLGSCLECEAILDIAENISIINEEQYNLSISTLSELGKMLNGLIRSLDSN